MKTFDLKKFRGSTGLNQEEFAKRIQRSQTTVSRIEKGEKAMSDKFLDAVSKGFSIDLEVYKSYNQQTLGYGNMLLDTHIHDTSSLVVKHDNPDLEQRYIKLLEERAKIEREHHILIERLNVLESTILVENTQLLKRLTTQNELILNLLSEIEKK
ncbi:MAG: helix-turn-helix transcriptional regulator [Chitinophagales bacterium]|nr:helix-turn-helix transcriptional regulator [Chitinophagales bacterium]